MSRLTLDPWVFVMTSLSVILVAQLLPFEDRAGDPASRHFLPAWRPGDLYSRTLPLPRPQCSGFLSINHFGVPAGVRTALPFMMAWESSISQPVFHLTYSEFWGKAKAKHEDTFVTPVLQRGPSLSSLSAFLVPGPPALLLCF